MKKRFYYMDLAAVVACIAVVMLHTSTIPYSYGVGDVQTRPKVIIFCIVLTVICAFAVPFFFMNSGANILNYRERYDTKTFFVKRIKKVVIPFTFWSILAYCVMNHNKSVPDFLGKFITHNIEPDYWFFYAIIGFYLAAPILSTIVSQIPKRLFMYFIILAITIESIFPLLSVMSNADISLQVPIVGAFLQYFLIGYYIAHRQIPERYVKIVYLAGIVFFFAIIIVTILATFSRLPSWIHFQKRLLVPNFYDIGAFPTVMMVTAWYLFISRRESFLKKCYLNKVLPMLSRLTYGIYIIHPIVIYILMNTLERKLYSYPVILQSIAYPAVIIIISVTLTIIIKKIPFVRELIP